MEEFYDQNSNGHFSSNTSYNFTGERMVTSLNNCNAYEHIHRYLFALDYVNDKIVLDLGCGEGYGVNILSNKAKSIIGIDIDEDIIKWAKSKYIKKNIEFLYGNIYNIPLDNNSIDTIVCFETIEHVSNHEIVLNEIKRVLKKDGVLIISTPDSYVYNNKLKIINEFHVKELTQKEFEDLLNKSFNFNSYYKQLIQLNSLIINNSNIKNVSIECYNANFETYKLTNFNSAKILISVSSDFEINKSNKVSILNLDELQISIMKDIKNTYRYKIGNLIVMPIQKIIKWLKLDL